MLIDKLGEFGLIKEIKKMINLDSSVLKGIGDDCAVLKFTKDKYLLFTCDMIVEGVDFQPKEKRYLVGRKSVAISLSDIAACAGIPKYALVSLGLPINTTIKQVRDLYKGMLGIAREYGLNLVGGDISRSNKLTIDVSIIGEVEKKKIILRDKAKIGDIIFVTGNLGGSILGRHLKFRPRIKEARYLVNNFKINSMIDISDGLSQDLGHILEESRVGALIYETLIPLTKEAKNLQDALYSGEDFELLFTLPLKEARRLIRENKIFKPIGEIMSEKYGFKILANNARLKNIQIKGFRHF
jgi:thiamine-monophosphate kinase